MDKETEKFIMKMTQKMSILLVENIELQTQNEILNEKIAQYEQQQIENTIAAHEEQMEGK